ncbi:hypothetical protein KCU73_g1319, partial [Aureobasidium melanogenum]
MANNMNIYSRWGLSPVVWFMGCGNGKELDELFSRVPTAAIKGIEKSGALAAKVRDNLLRGSLRHQTPVFINTTVWECGFADLDATMQPRSFLPPPDIIVCLDVMHLFTEAHQARILNMWLGSLLNQVQGNRIIFTTRHQNQSYMHCFHAMDYTSRQPAPGIKFTVADRADRVAVQQAGDRVAQRVVTNLHISRTSATYPASEAGPNALPSPWPAWIGLAHGERYDVPQLKSFGLRGPIIRYGERWGIQEVKGLEDNIRALVMRNIGLNAIV